MNILIFLIAIFLVFCLVIFYINEKTNKKILSINGVMLANEELEKYALMLSSKHVITYKSSLKTYPINRVKDNYRFICEVYNVVNSHVNMGINIDPSRRMATR